MAPGVDGLRGEIESPSQIADGHALRVEKLTETVHAQHDAATARNLQATLDKRQDPADNDRMDTSKRETLLRRLRRAFGATSPAPTIPCEGCGDRIEASYGRDRCEKCVRDAARIAAHEPRETLRAGGAR